LLNWLLRHGFNQQRVIIAGGGELALEVISRLQQARWSGLHIVGTFCAHDPAPELAKLGVPFLGRPEELSAYEIENRVDQIWIALPLSEEATVKRLLHDLRHSTADIRYVPDIFGFRLINHSIADIAGVPVVNLSVTPISGINRVIKAIEDRLISILILLLVSPVMAVIAIGVKRSSPGPIFYTQERVGWNGKPFTMLKFRSMPDDSERNGVQWGNAAKKETTRFGTFLRRTSLDELPQFLNVLKGEMSIVGPRPERPVFVKKFKDEIPDYMKKHLVKAGITGWAQINGYRGDTDLNKRIEYDLFYIENWSLSFDLKIILLTLLKGFVHPSAK
jgi:putative colanic acid biosynthesis UDP-glucose lipid carrier transferase